MQKKEQDLSLLFTMPLDILAEVSSSPAFALPPHDELTSNLSRAGLLPSPSSRPSHCLPHLQDLPSLPPLAPEPNRLDRFACPGRLPCSAAHPAFAVAVRSQPLRKWSLRGELFPFSFSLRRRESSHDFESRRYFSALADLQPQSRRPHLRSHDPPVQGMSQRDPRHQRQQPQARAARSPSSSS